MSDSSDRDYHTRSETESASLFIGRAGARTAFHRYLNNPQPRHALVVIGQPLSGKTRLLHQLATADDDLYSAIAPRLTPPVTEAVFLHQLYADLYARIRDGGVNASRLPLPPDDLPDAGWRAWFAETALPGLLAPLRNLRRIVVLLDDADELLDALAAGTLPADFPAYMQGLLVTPTHPGLYLVLMLPLAAEDRLGELSPLVNPIEIFRLRALTPDDLTAAYPDYPVMALHQAAGGHPWLTAQLLARLHDHTPGERPTPEAVRAVLPALYEVSGSLYHGIWRTLTQNERLALTAMITLLYDDPLRAITAADLEKWLIETDYRPDLTAIHAALRSLEYRELLVVDHGRITLTADLFKRWLIENARLTGLSAVRTDLTGDRLPEPSAARAAAAPGGTRLPGWLLPVVGAVIALLLLALILTGGQPDASPDPTGPVPTLTLAPNPTMTP